MGADIRLHVGTYAQAGGQGLYPLSRDRQGWHLGAPEPAIRNASFGVYSPRHRCHYLVDEQARGAIGTWRLTGGQWHQFARADTQGDAPCHVALSPNEDQIAVSNYGSGSVALFRLAADTGFPVAPASMNQDHGRGPNTERQDGPHAHCAAFQAGHLFHVDLGTDQVFATPLRAEAAEPGIAYQAPPGTGPRHLLFHPHRPIALLVSELASTLTLLETSASTLEARVVLSTLPADFAGESLGGHLGINSAGDRIYVTNRGHDSVAVFRLAGDDLELIQHVESGGASPRSFLLLEEESLLLMANEKAGNITAFAVEDDGRLAPEGQIASIPGAAFIFRDHAPLEES